jgi:hypothetical protein
MLCCMVWLTTTGAVEPPAQDKVLPEKTDEKTKSAVKDDKKEARPAAGKAITPPVLKERAKKAAGVKAAAPARAVPALRIAPAMNVNGNLFVQQFMPHFRKALKAELHFMRLVCDCNRAQYEKVAGEVEPTLKTMAEKFGQKNPNGFIMINTAQAGHAGDEDNDPRYLISMAIAKSIRKQLPAEMADRYDQEIAARLEASKQAVVQGYVARLDKILHLTTEQRDRLTKVLDKKWKYSPSRARLLTMGGNYFPTMPEAEIKEILTPPQQRVWSGIQRQQISFGVSLNDDNEPEIQETWDAPDGKKDASDPKRSDRKPTSERAKLP